MDINPGEFSIRSQEAMDRGASQDQAAMYAAADIAMEIGTRNTPIDVLLDSMEGDPKKAMQIMEDALKQSRVKLTNEELHFVGMVAAEASARQQGSGFAQNIAIEMLTGKSYEEAQGIVSQKLWQNTLKKAIHSSASEVYTKWIKSMGAENTELNTIDEYEKAGYNESREYELLNGYSSAIEKRDISPLVGFDLYKRTNDDIQAAVVGQVTSTGIEIKSFCTHFIDRVIGQTSDSHEGMRQGVPISSILGALQSPVDLGNVRYMEDGDIRQTFYGNGIAVTISIRDRRLIQTNPWKG